MMLEKPTSLPPMVMLTSVGRRADSADSCEVLTSVVVAPEQATET